MSEATSSKGPNRALLLLIPAAMVVAKGVRHRRAIWDPGRTPSAATGHRYGHQMRFGGDMNAAAGSFRLPPKIEWMLDAWHTRAHERSGSAELTARDSRMV